jgi:site-specific recombinase XerD
LGAAITDAAARRHLANLANSSDRDGSARAGAQALATGIPTLEDFAAQFDPDMYSEAELIELFEARYSEKLVAVNAMAGLISQRIAALDWLQSRLAKIPRGEDATAQWLSPDTCSALAQGGVLNLGDVATYRRSHGKHWYQGLAGLGRTRALRLESWLAEHVQGCALAARNELVVSSFAVVDPRVAYPQLDGSAGVFRRLGVNTLGANNDYEAVSAWFETLAGKSAHTTASYQREIERFYLWAQRCQGKALSSLDATDCMAYRAFILDPPAGWVSRLPCARSSPDWRPFRGALSVRSATKALTVVAALYNDLVAAGYLAANPMPRLSMGASQHATLDTERSFGQGDILAMEQTLAALPDSASKRRLRALVLLTYSAGLRRSEIACMRWCDLSLSRQGAAGEVEHSMRVQGKGGKERFLPLRRDVLQALALHHRDRLELKAQGRAIFGNVDPEDLPLIGVLEHIPHLKGEEDLGGGALSGAALNAVLKRFFKLVPQTVPVAQGGADFSKATMHWMRHTFGHEVLVSSGNNLPTVQRLLGHASLNTTGIYLAANMSDRVEAVRGLRGFGGS